MSGGAPVTFKVEELMDLIEKGEVQIPEFQREYVWDQKRVMGLIIAILKDHPVGSLLGFEVNSASQLPFQIRPIRGAENDIPEDAECKHLVLDGQQRLTALWHALKDKSPSHVYFLKYPVKNVEILEGNAARRPVEGKVTWVNDKKKCVGNGYVPVYLFTKNSDEVREWIDQAHEDEKGKVDAVHTRSLHRWVMDMGRKILAFEIPYLSLPSSTSPEEAIELFVKSNTSAQRLSTFDITVAVMHQKRGENLRDLRDETGRQVPDILNYVSKGDLGDLLIKIACLRKDLSPTQSNYQNEYVLSELDNNIGEIQEGLRWTCEILKHDFFFSQKFLPSRIPLRVLPALYGALPDNDRFRDICQKWAREYLWRAFFTSRYSSDAAQLLLADFKDLRDSFLEKRKWELAAIRDEEKYPLPGVEQLATTIGWPRTQGALPRAILAVSLREGARDFGKNQKINEKNIDKMEAHHIFPKRYLMKASIEDMANATLNCMLIHGDTNRRASDKPPLEYLEALYYNAGHTSIDEKDIKQRLESHLIPAELLLRRNVENVQKHYEEFLLGRAKLLLPHMKALTRGDDP